VKPDKLNKYCDLVAKELRSIKKNSVKSEELNRAKEFYEGQIALGFEKTMSRMLWMGENMISTESVPTVKEVLEKVKKVKIEDIRRLAAKIFNKDNLSVAVIGPAKEGMKLEFDL
jgi:predicted Zn-dependent peptidase